VRLGAHLPLADLGDGVPTAAHIRGYVNAARELGFSTVAANDHLTWRHPWLDGPMTLASVVDAAGDMTLATTITLPVIRQPVVVAKALTTLAALAQGPVIGGMGPGSSRSDYAVVGIPFDERWGRFDEAFRVVRALVRGEECPEPGTFYATQSRLSPTPEPAPQIWFGSWGSDRRLAAMAATADGWFASGYNATPSGYAETRCRLDRHLQAAGRPAADFPDAVATTWFYLTDEPRDAQHLLNDVLAPTLDRDPAQLEHLPIGSPEHCTQVLADYAAAGARELLVWPLRDSVRQLERCMDAASVLDGTASERSHQTPQ
jgi:alkanesulfonate monooxygenase SsuD/methylene tetrahydromethanopterin reductase-like flavin-dependent oxidoreductase (luciferase family)